MVKNDLLHICNSYQTNKMYQLLFDEIAEFNNNQIVIAPGFYKSGIEENNNIKIIYYKRTKSLFQRVLFRRKTKKIFIYINGVLNLSTVRLVHAHTLFSDGAVAYNLYKEYDIPYVVAVRNTDIETFFKKMFWLRSMGYDILRNASKIYFISKSNLNNFLKVFPREIIQQIEKKIEVSPNGINKIWLENRFIRREACLSSTINIVYCGDIVSNKNILNVAKAIKTLNERGYSINYHVIGLKDKQTSSYIRKIQKFQRKNSFFSMYPHSEITSLITFFRQSDMFVMPSFKETFGLVYIEALSQGLPIIYTEGQGIDGTFPEGTVGYHVTPSCVNSIVEGIEKTIKNYSFIHNQIKSLNISQYDWAKIASKYNNDYQTI